MHDVIIIFITIVLTVCFVIINIKQVIILQSTILAKIYETNFSVSVK